MLARSILRKAVKNFPPIRRLVEQRDTYYSPIPRLEEIKARQDEIFAVPASIPAVDMREGAQLNLIEQLSRFYGDQPFSATPSDGLRYHFENGWFQFADGLILYALLRHLNPQRIIEVGSGFSSALMLDTNDLFLDGKVALTFIDPNPQRVLRLLRDEDSKKAQVISKPVHEVDSSMFDELQPGDILFVDGSHVSRVGSDVNKIFFEILPRLQAGVMIHVHDIFYPFEYPKDWIYMGRFWNEAYLVRAFLMYNASFRITLSNSFLHKFHFEQVSSLMPLWGAKEGASLWMERMG